MFCEIGCIIAKQATLEKDLYGLFLKAEQADDYRELVGRNNQKDFTHIQKLSRRLCVGVLCVCVCLNRSFYPKTYTWKGKLHASKASLIIEF